MNNTLVQTLYIVLVASPKSVRAHEHEEHDERLLSLILDLQKKIYF